MSDNLREWTVAEMAADAGAPEGRIRDIIRRLEITPRRKLGRQQCYSARRGAGHARMCQDGGQGRSEARGVRSTCTASTSSSRS
jgi:hypothetical protein